MADALHDDGGGDDPVRRALEAALRDPGVTGTARKVAKQKLKKFNKKHPPAAAAAAHAAEAHAAAGQSPARPPVPPPKANQKCWC